MLQQVYIYPDKPLPALTAEWIVDNLCVNSYHTAFEKTLVIVPTKSAAKNLREELIKQISNNQRTTLAGVYIETFETLISELSQSQNIASSTQRFAAWLKALENSKSLKCIFPNAQPKRENLFESAKELDSLAAIVSEKLMTFQDVLNFIKKESSTLNDYEITLWTELASIENLYLKYLDKDNLECKYRAFAKTVRSTKVDYDKIVIAMNPDAPASLEAFVQNISNQAKIFVLIATEKATKDRFDIIGRPSTHVYENVSIDISEKNTLIFPSVSDEAEAVAELVSEYGELAKDILGISCEQTENADIFKEKIARKNLRAEIPEQRKLSQSMLFKLLKTASKVKENDSFFEFTKALENPLLSKAIVEHFEIEESQLLEIADDVRERLVPNTTKTLLTNLRLRNETRSFEILNFIDDILENLTSENPLLRASKAREILDVCTGKFEDAILEFEKLTLQALSKCASEIAHADNIYSFTKNDVSKIIFEALENSRGGNIDFSDCILLNNWIEIFWSRKPHLLLCDINDGTVPLSEKENQFITDSLKKRLGVKNSEQRRARDAYMLLQLLKSRPNAVQILFSIKDASQAPIMPSRILMQSQNLPERVKFLFKEPSASKIELSAPTLIPLKVDEKLPKDFSMSASKFNSYLKSPLDFYINYILKANEVSPDKSELDALQYGTILHLLMKKFALSQIRNSQDWQEISQFLSNELSSLAETEFGSEISAQIRIQLFTMRQKLTAIAKAQAIHAANGWHIWGNPERVFKYKIGSMVITGSIDRIDYNEQLNKYVIIDYKTYNKFSPQITQQTHFKKLDEDGNPIWENLQMPLYKLAMQQTLGDCECAFFVSPQETTETDIDFWDIPEEMLSNAHEKMEEIINDIRNGVFLPEDPPKFDICKNTFDISGKTLLAMMRK